MISFYLFEYVQVQQIRVSGAVEMQSFLLKKYFDIVEFIVFAAI